MYIFVICKLCSCMETFISKLTLGIANLRIRRRPDLEEINRGIRILEARLSQRHVAGDLVVLQCTVAKMWERFRTHGNVRYRHGSGRERVTIQHEDCFIVVQTQGLLRLPACKNDLQNATSVKISTQTITSRLHRAIVWARRPAICIPLMQNHILARLPWVRTHIRWKLNDWTPVLFNDESRFCMDFKDIRVWRSSNQRFAPRIRC